MNTGASLLSDRKSSERSDLIYRRALGGLAAGVVALILTASTNARATPSFSSSSASAAAELGANSPSASASSDDVVDFIEPLDNWVAVEQPKVSSSSSSSTVLEDEEEDPFLYEGAGEGREPTNAASSQQDAKPGAHSFERAINARKNERFRFRKIIKRSAKYRANASASVRSMIPNQLGAPEAVLCSVNFNSVGFTAKLSPPDPDAEPEEKPKKVKPKKPKVRPPSFELFTKLTTAEKCHVIAFQSMSAPTHELAEAKLKGFVTKLERATKTKWKQFLGQSASPNVWNGFVVVDGIVVKSVRSLHSMPLVTFSGSERKQFARGPVELTAEIPGEEEKQPRVLVMFTFDLRGPLVKPELSEPEALQAAETLRAIVAVRKLRTSNTDQTLFVLAGDSGVQRDSIVELVLRGRMWLKDFAEGGGCSCPTEEPCLCGNPTRRGPLFFSLFDHRDVRGPGQIYVFSESIPFFENHQQAPQRRVIGTVPVPGADPPRDSFQWAEVNW